MRYALSGLGTAISFVEFGALALIVNEFASHGVTHARTGVLLWSFGLLAISNFIPSIIDSFNNYATSIQIDDMARHLQSLQFNKMNELDIGTIEQPEFQNILQITKTRGCCGCQYFTCHYFTTGIVCYFCGLFTHLFPGTAQCRTFCKIMERQQ
jgi:hypothetical protein